MSVLALHRAYDLSEPASLRLDLKNPKPKEILAIAETFTEAAKANPDLGPLPVTTGWNNVTPEIAVNLLQRNRPGANRRIDPGTVFYYANQMAEGDWKATGQPILIDADGVLQDSQHRLFAVVVSGATIKTFVVTDIEPIKNMFAYIDNVRVRTPAVALQTAGFDGVSPIITKVIRIGEEIKHGVYDPAGATKLPRMSPARILHLVDDYPNAKKAARSAASDWSEVVELIGGRKEVVAYLGMRITDLNDEYVADDFFEEVGDTTKERAADDPVGALHKLIDKDNRADRQMKRQHMLAAMIKVFNAWHKKEALGRRWMLQVDENFPEVEAGESSNNEEAA
jgi:hypothetical protein